MNFNIALKQINQKKKFKNYSHDYMQAFIELTYL